MLQTEYAVLKPPGICCDAGVCAKAAGHKVKHASCPYLLLIISSLEAAAGTYLLPRLTASCLAPLCIPNRAGLFKTSTLQEADVTQQFSRRYKQNTLLPRATGKHLAVLPKNSQLLSPELLLKTWSRRQRLQRQRAMEAQGLASEKKG